MHEPALEPPAARPRAVILDVEGTLCDVRPVRHHVQAPPGEGKFRPNFHKFHAESIDCPPHAAVVAIAGRARERGWTVLVVTGREAKWAELTERWLAKHDVPYDALRTRAARDYRPDHVVKTEIERDLRKRYDLRLALDDREDIVAVWRAAGIATVHVSESGQLGKVVWPSGVAPDAGVAALLA